MWWPCSSAAEPRPSALTPEPFVPGWGHLPGTGAIITTKEPRCLYSANLGPWFLSPSLFLIPQREGLSLHPGLSTDLTPLSVGSPSWF